MLNIINLSPPTNPTTDKQIRTYYMNILINHLNNHEPIINVIDESHPTIKWVLFLEAMWVISLNLQLQSPQINQLAAIVSHINAKSYVDINTLLLQLSDDLIYLSGLMEQKAHDKKMQRTFTKLNYDQNKYNLMRDNNEGFAKISLLLLSITDKSDRNTIWHKVVELIGNYDLDPDRVLDLILQSYIQNPNSTILISILTQFNTKSIPPLLGHRLTKSISQNISNQLVYIGSVENLSNVTIKQLSKQFPFMVNPNLMRVMASLIKSEMLQLDKILVYLKPDDDVINKVGQKKIDAGKQKVLKAFVMQLQQLDIKQKQKQIDEDHITFLGQMIYSTKFALMSQLVRINDWGNFIAIYETLPKLFDLLLYQPLLNNICDLLQWMIDPVYNKISFSVYFQFQRPTCKQFPVENVKTLQMKQFSTINKQFFDGLTTILAIMGPYIGFRSTTYIKICRLLKKMMKNPQQISDGSDNNEMIGQITKQYLLPGINYQMNNPAISLEFYQLYELFDYKFRYDGYLTVYKARMTQNPYVCKIFQNVKNKTNIIVNNLSKDNKKIFFKKMAKITHDQSLQVFYWIVRRLMREDYEAVVPEIVGAMANCTPLALEMAMFVFIYSLAEQKEVTVDCKTGQCKPWFKNIIMFIGLFYRKYLQTDIQPVFDYILLKLQQPIRDVQDNQQLPGSLLNLLQGLLNKMFGNFMMQEVNKTKYDILAAGPRLQFEALYLTSQIRAAKKSKMILQNFFWDKTINYGEDISLALHLLVLLAQKKAEFIHKTYIGDLKIIGDIYDSYNQLLIQFIRFLNYQSTDHLHFAKLLPTQPFPILLNHYKLSIEVAFEIWRPSLKPVALMTNEEWNQTTQLIHSTMEASNKQLIEGKHVNNKLKHYLSLWKDRFTKTISIGFFSAFWLLSLDSIYYPKAIYSQKIEQQRKKIQQNLPTKKGIPERQLEKVKTLYEKLIREDQLQKKKNLQTLSDKNLMKLQLQIFTNPNIDKAANNATMIQFADSFVQMCLLPRLLLSASEALYCVKFTMELIKVNKLSSAKTIKLIGHIIELLINYLPFATEKQASNCLAVYISQAMSILQNWNDSTKLKQDLKKYLNIDENALKDNYAKIRDSILRIYQKVGNLLKSIKQQPYIIKNCLYLLEKVDCIPGYKQQAEELENHLKDLKELHLTVDMKTILERQITMISFKKALLPEKPDSKHDRKSESRHQPKPQNKQQSSRQQSSKQQSSRQQSSRQQSSKQQNRQQSRQQNKRIKGQNGSKSPIEQNKGGIKGGQKIEGESQGGDEMSRPTGIKTVKQLRQQQLKANDIKKLDQPRKDYNESNTQLYVRKDIGSQNSAKSQLEELKERRASILQHIKTTKNNLNGQAKRSAQQVLKGTSGPSGIQNRLAVEVNQGRRQEKGKHRETEIGEIESGEQLGTNRSYHEEHQRRNRSRQKKNRRQVEGQQRVQRQRKGFQRHKRQQGVGSKEGTKKRTEIDQQEIGQIRQVRQKQ